MKIRNEELVTKGETLRTLYFLRRLGEELDEDVTADERYIKKSLFPLFKKVEELIPFLEREMPEWARELARGTFDIRTGFMIWEPKGIK